MHVYRDPSDGRGVRVTYGFTRHARTRMRQLGMGVSDVVRIIREDDVIERYADRAGVLLHGRDEDRDIHVSLVRSSSGVTLVTTVYEVDPGVFPDGRTRRSEP